VGVQINLRRTYRVHQFNPQRDDFEDLLILDRKILTDEKNYLDVARAKEWCKINPTIFYILTDNRKNVHGYLGVIPIRWRFIKDILIDGQKRDLFPLSLTKEYVLSETETRAVAQKEGNSIFATAHFRNPDTGKMDHQFGILLFVNMFALFFKHRMRTVIGRSVTSSGKAMFQNGGFVKICDLRKTSDGIPSIYYFDMDLALDRPSTGLGVIMTLIWGVKGHKVQNLLNLNEHQKEILKLEFSGFTRKEVADHLGIGIHTVEGRWKGIDKKGAAMGLHNRRSIKGYAFQNYFEFM